jgi:phosphatidylglycerol lysyltransferase
VCQLALARGIARHKRVAWFLTLVLLAVTAVLHLARAFDWHHTLAALILIVPLIRWKKEFVARSDAASLRFAWVAAAVLALGLWAYGTFGLYQFSEKGNFGEPMTVDKCASIAVSEVFLLKTVHDTEASRDVRRFLSNLRLGSLCIATIALALFLRPVLERRYPEATDEERSRVKDIMAKHGRDPMDSFALLTDKRYFFSVDGEGFVAYSLWRKFAVALADPVCPAESRNAVIHAFARFCKEQDWEPVFYCAHVVNRTTYEEEGFITFKVGEDARLSVADFKLEGGKFQNLRTARNKARKNGLTMQWYQATPQIDHGLEAQLQILSQDWLNRKHGGEMTFDLGSFDLKLIHERGAAIVRNPEGRIEAFATWLSYNQGKGRCLDLMRGREEARDVMDFLIVEAVDHFKAEGVEEVSLGNAPLANVDADSGLLQSRQERAVKFLFDNFDRYYGYKSLFNFKKKYQPEWQGRYLAYRPRTSLTMVGLAIAGVHLPRGFIGLLRS